MATKTLREQYDDAIAAILRGEFVPPASGHAWAETPFEPASRPKAGPMRKHRTSHGTEYESFTDTDGETWAVATVDLW